MVAVFGNLAIVGIVAASFVVWARIVAKLRRREPLVPYEPRPAVPWTGWDVALIVLWWLSADLVAGAVAARLEGPSLPAAAAPTGRGTPAPHLVLVLLQSNPNPATLLVCLLTAVVLAPVVEEFLFRLLLQGWLERVAVPPETQSVSRARLPLSLWLPAAVFALFHFRLEREPPPPETIVRFLLASAAARSALLVLGVAWLRLRPDQSPTLGARPATWRDLGIVPERFAADLRLGLVGLAAAIVPVMGLQAALNAWLPELLAKLGWPAFAPDPVPLLFLALALGYLYRQTHRIVPSIVLHAGLNATSVLAAWLGTQAPAG